MFEIPPIQTTVESSHCVQYKPISSLTNDSPIEFVLPGNGEEYIDLAHTMLSLRVSLKDTSEPAEPVAAQKKCWTFQQFHALSV